MNDFPNIPCSWQVKTLGEVCDIISKGATPKIQTKTADNNSAFFLKAENVTQNGCVNFDNVNFIDYKTHTTTLKRSMLKNLDILITIAGSLARCAVLEINPNQQININQAVSFARLKDTSKVNPHFVKYFIMNPTMQLYLLSKAKTTAVPNLTLEIIRDTKIPIPSLEIQKRIVKRLDEAFARIENGTKHLQSAKDNLTKYKQSLLKSAFNGTLTQDCHESANADSRNDDKDSLNGESANLPQGWTIKTLGEIAQIKGGKRLPKDTKYAETATPYPYIRVTDFENMSVDTTNLKYLTKETQQKIKNYTISKDNVYISIAGSIGKVGTIPDELDNANLTENAAKIVHSMDKKYLAFYLNSAEMQYQIAFSTKATTQPKLALYRIENLKIKIPPLEIQKQIVAILEKHFTSADKVGAHIDSCLTKAKQLKSSLLKSAFEGKLI